MPRTLARIPAVAVPPAHCSASALDGDDALRGEARFLHWFGQETIAFNRGYVEITGNVVSALWLSYVLERMPQDVRSGRGQLDGERYRFSMTAADCEAATGITRAQQTGCRSQLEDLGLVQVDGVRGKVASYTIDLRRLREIMTEQARPLLAALQEARMHECAARNGLAA